MCRTSYIPVSSFSERCRTRSRTHPFRFSTVGGTATSRKFSRRHCFGGGGGNGGDGSTEITAGTAPGFPPFEMKQDGELVGFDIDLLEAVIDETDYTLAGWEEFEFKSLIPALTNENIDVVAAGMTINDERDETIDFTDPYYSSNRRLSSARTATSRRRLCRTSPDALSAHRRGQLARRRYRTNSSRRGTLMSRTTTPMATTCWLSRTSRTATSTPSSSTSRSHRHSPPSARSPRLHLRDGRDSALASAMATTSLRRHSTTACPPSGMAAPTRT